VTVGVGVAGIKPTHFCCNVTVKLEFGSPPNKQPEHIQTVVDSPPCNLTVLLSPLQSTYSYG
jgi:hypothetical protein